MNNNVTWSAGVPPAPSPSSEDSNWKTRGYLPHYDGAKWQFITIRLFDSVPFEIVQQWKDELKYEKDISEKIKLQKMIAEYEDKGHGNCYLKVPDIAKMMVNTLKFHNGKKYHLLAWSVMPNHVHFLIEPLDSLEKIIHSIKSYSAHEANKILNKTGAFWFNDYFDRYIRNAKHYNLVMDYILNNPIKAHYTEQYTGYFVEGNARETRALLDAPRKGNIDE